MALPRLARATMVVLLAAAVLEAPYSCAENVIATSDELKGLQAGCEKASNGGDLNEFVLSDAACKSCMSSLNGLASPMNTRMYACHTLCQNPTYFTASSGPPSQCQACLGVAKNTPYGCENCLRVLSSSDDRQGCIDCLARDPTNGKRPDYAWACAQCMRIPVTDGARDQCLTCISTDKARLITDGGMLPAEEAGSEVRDNDFGACVVLANRTYNIGQGSVEVDGVFANCVPKGYATANPKPFLPLGLNDCMACMQNVLSSTPRGPSFLHKEYACSSYCQDPNTYPMDLSSLEGQQAAKDLATACVECVEDPSVIDAWGCGNCMKATSPTACFECVKEDPYSGKASNYAWGCGQCGRISDPDLQGLCYQCIANQPYPELDANGVITNAKFNISTEANICSCIDLTLNSSIALSRGLDAQQRACFEPQQFYQGSTLVVPDIPWGNVTSADGTTSPCLQCIDTARSQANTQWDPLDNSNPPLDFPSKAYACTEYCQDFRLVADEADGEACADCVQSAQITDAFGCKMCMEATSDPVVRDACFSCLKAPTGLADFQWGCGECAKFGSADARTQCYRCMAGGVVDPCDCVSMTKNGTLPDVSGPCTTPGYKARIWYMAATYPSTAAILYELDSAAWSIDASNPWATNAVNVCSGTFSGTASTYQFTTTSDLRPTTVSTEFRAAVFTQDIALTGCTLAPGGEYFFTVKDAKVKGGGGVGYGKVFWDLSQAPGGDSYYYLNDNGQVLYAGVTPLEDDTYAQFEGGSLAFQLLDACDAVLVDTITTGKFGFGQQAASVSEPDASLQSGATRKFDLPVPTP